MNELSPLITPIEPTPDDDRNRAEFYTRLSNELNQQSQIVARRNAKAKATGIPANVYAGADNRYDKDNYDLKAVNPRLVNFMANNPDKVAYFKDELVDWNDAIDKLNEAFNPLPEELAGKVQRLTGEDRRSARTAQKELDSIPTLSPDTPEYAIQQAELTHQPRTLAEVERISKGQTVVSEATRKVAERNAIMNDIARYYGDWHNLNDEHLRALIDKAGELNGIDTSDWDLKEFREKGFFSGGVDFSQLVDFFGASSIARASEAMTYPELRPDALAKADSNSPLYVQLAKLRMLQEENDALRGTTMPAEVTNSLLSSIRLMSEMYASGGTNLGIKALMEGGYKTLLKEGLGHTLKTVGKGVLKAGWSGLKRMPFYLPQSAAEAYNQNYLGGSVTLPGDDGIEIEVKDEDVANFWQGLVSHLAQNYIEVTSEELGDLIPFGDADVTLLAHLVPKKLRNAIVAKLAWSPITQKLTYRAIQEAIPIHGVLGEYAEEELGNIMIFIVTTIMEGLGAAAENTPGTETLLLSGKERELTKWSVGLQSLLFHSAVALPRVPAGIKAIKDARIANRELPAMIQAADALSKTSLPEASQEELEGVLEQMYGASGINIPVEQAEALRSQEGATDQEKSDRLAALDAMGLTQEAIDNAKKRGTDVVLSQKAILAVGAKKSFKSGREMLEAVINSAVSETFGKSYKEISGEKWTKEKADEIVKYANDHRKFVTEATKIMASAINTATQNAKDKAIAEGKPEFMLPPGFKRAVTNFQNVFAFMANYLYKNTLDEGRAAMLDMARKLSIQFAENPDEFKASEAVQELAKAGKTGAPRIQLKPNHLTTVEMDDATRENVAKELKGTLRKSTPEMRGFRVSDLGDAYAEVQAKGLEAGDIGNSFDAHGIAKGMMGTQVDALLNLLGNGIDQNKDFYTAPFALKEEDRTAGAGVGIGTATNGAYKDGLAVLVSEYGKKLTDGVGVVFINPAVADDFIPILREKFPGVRFENIADQKRVLQEMADSARKELDAARAVTLNQEARSLNDSIAKAAKQEIGSGDTSLDQVAAGFKKIDFQPGTVNLDLGGGKFDKGTEYLAEKGVTNLVYDPVNRSAESNTKIFEAIKNGGVDTVTCNNVLNVIKEAGARSNVILQAAKALKPGGVAYFTVYEGDGSGKGHETSKGWQEHRKTADYMDEIKQHFGDVVRHGKIIEARNPIIEGKTSAWFNEGFESDPLLYQLIGELGAFRLQDAMKNYERLEKAREMEAAGASVEEIWKKTGWERGKDGLWVMEIPDLTIKIPKAIKKARKQKLKDLLTTATKLGDLIDAPVLFEAYPDMKDVPVEFAYKNDRNIAFHQPKAGIADGLKKEYDEKFEVNTKFMSSLNKLKNGIPTGRDITEAEQKEIFDLFEKDLRTNLVHEVQHAVQMREDFAEGGSDFARAERIKKLNESSNKLRDEVSNILDELENIKNAQKDARAENAISAYIHKIQNNFSVGADYVSRFEKTGMSKGDIAKVSKLIREASKKADEIRDNNRQISNIKRNGYWGSAGEVQSRNAEERLNLSEQERRDIPPIQTEDARFPRNQQIILDVLRHTKRAEKMVKAAEKKMRALRDAERKAKEAEEARKKAEEEARKKAEAEATEKARQELLERLKGRLKELEEAEAKAREEAERARAEAEAAQAEAEKARAEAEEARRKAVSILSPGGSINGAIAMAGFEQSHQAIIGLFKTANASTLPHECAHWLKKAMETLVAHGLANDQMKEDLDTINEWLNKQDYTGMSDAERAIAREEYFARAFEQYLREGKFPQAATSKLKSALYRLASALKSIYLRAVDLNAPIDDSIRSFFDSMFVADYVAEETSLLSEILRDVNAGALGLSASDMKKLEDAIAGAKSDAKIEAWLTALQAYRKGLREQKPIWKKEAEEAYDNSKGEQAYVYVRNGHKLDIGFLRDVLKLPEDVLNKLKAKRLTASSSGEGVSSPVPPPVQVEPEPQQTVPDVHPLAGVSAEDFAARWKELPSNQVLPTPDNDTLANILLTVLNGTFTKETEKGVKVNINGLEWVGPAFEKLKDGKLPVGTRGGNALYIIRTAVHEAIEEYNKSHKGDQISLDETTGEGGKSTVGDIIPANPSPEQIGYFDEDTIERLKQWVAAIQDETRREVARIVVKSALSGNTDGLSGTELIEKFRAANPDSKLSDKSLRNIYTAVRQEFKEILSEMLKQENVSGEQANVPADIMATMSALGYTNVMQLVTDLVAAKGRVSFIRDYINEKEAMYKEEFLSAPEWNSETGATRYLDAILSALEVTKGMKYNVRKQIAKSEALKELKGKTVREILGTIKNTEKSLRTAASDILKALKSNKEDKAAAITAALNMYKNAARLEAARELQGQIQMAIREAANAAHAKAGTTMSGDALNAIKAVRYRFRLSETLPNWGIGVNDPKHPLTAMKALIDRYSEMMYFEDEKKKEQWQNDVFEGFLNSLSTWAQERMQEGFGKDSRISFGDLTLDQFNDVMNIIDMLSGLGRDVVEGAKDSLVQKREKALAAILPSLDAHATGKYTNLVDKTDWEKVKAAARSGIHMNKTLVFLAHWLDGNTEFFGEHVIGPVRKYLQLVLSEGASKEMYWYQKISKEVKPHVLALMRSAKERGLKAQVNNETTQAMAYQDIHGEAMAFVLLNSGTPEGRQRLKEGFGWTEDELNGVLSQFTKEDFDHAEAIWSILNEMGQQVANVFYKERHYRMKWAEKSPIELTLQDGTRIVSEGGYFPIYYAYNNSPGNLETDIMNPFVAPNKPARPGSTHERTAIVKDACLLLNATGLERHIAENARYIGMWEPLQIANAIWTDKRFKTSVTKNFSAEVYKTMKTLMDNVNNPEKDRGPAYKFAQRLSACMATAALGFKVTTMAKQYASLTIGMERLGDYFTDAIEYGLKDLRGLRQEVSDLSAFMRDRYNLMDRDLKVVNSEFKNKLGQAVDKYRYAAFYGLKQNDLNVASVQWYAAYQWAIHNGKEGMTKSQAIAYADDFVASTQGAARTIDIPAIQLSAIGRALTPFFGPACAAANTRLAGLMAMKNMEAGERIAFAVDNLLAPCLIVAFISAAAKGLFGPGKDDDDWDRVRRAFFMSLMSEPVSGIPLVQDAWDSLIRSVQNGGKTRYGNKTFEVGLLDPANEMWNDFQNILGSLDNPAYVLYLGASITGMALQMPAIQAFESYEKMFNDNFGRETTVEKQLRGGGKK